MTRNKCNLKHFQSRVVSDVSGYCTAIVIKLLISPEYSCLDIVEYCKTTQNNIGRGKNIMVNRNTVKYIFFQIVILSHFISNLNQTFKSIGWDLTFN